MSSFPFFMPPAATLGKKPKKLLETVGISVTAPIMSPINFPAASGTAASPSPRAIVTDPAIILADEPTGALDSRTGEEILALFKTLNRNGRTIIVVTHDLKVAQHCQREIYIKRWQSHQSPEITHTMLLGTFIYDYYRHRPTRHTRTGCRKRRVWHSQETRHGAATHP